MDIIGILQSKPVLIGLHLGFAIIGIDAFLASWIAGGYYYVVYYGTLVKPVIKSGVAPWVHNIIMETKEHIFLFIIPLAMTILFVTLLEKEEMERLWLRRLTLWLSCVVAVLGLLIGAMGFVISAAARWGAIN